MPEISIRDNNREVTSSDFESTITTAITTTIITTTTFKPASIKAARQRLSIKENLGYFQILGSDGPLSWGFLSPFLLEEDCLVQYKARILKQTYKI